MSVFDFISNCFFFLSLSCNVDFVLIVCRKMTPGKVNANDNASNADFTLPMEVSLIKEETNINEIKDVKKPTVSLDTDVSSTLEKSEQKLNDTSQKTRPFDEKLKLDVSFAKNVSLKY